MLTWESFSSDNADSIEVHKKFLQLTGGISDADIRALKGKAIQFVLAQTVYSGVLLDFEEVGGHVQSFTVTVDSGNSVEVMDVEKVNGRFYVDGQVFLLSTIPSPPRLRRLLGSFMDDDGEDTEAESVSESVSESVMTELDPYLQDPKPAQPISEARLKLRALAAEARLAGYRTPVPPPYVPPRVPSLEDYPPEKPLTAQDWERVYLEHPDLRPQPLILNVDEYLEKQR